MILSARVSTRRYVKYLDNIRRIQVGDYRIRSATYCAPWPCANGYTTDLCARLGMQQHTAQTSSDPIRSHAVHCTTGTSTGTGTGPAPAPARHRHWPGAGPARHWGCAQDFLVSGADEFLVPKVDNTNVDRRESAAVRSTHPCGRCPHGSRVRTVHMHARTLSCTQARTWSTPQVLRQRCTHTRAHVHARTHAQTLRACRHNPKYTQGTHGH
jgi:hypothetical protein